MGMSDQEFYERYGRMPYRKKKKVKIYWHRIIIALIIFIGLIFGIVKLIGLAVDKLGGGDAKAASADSSSKVQTVKKETKKPEKKEESSSQKETEEKIAYSDVELIVCLDAAHGDYDAGTTDSDGTRFEKNDNLEIALKIRDYLESCGVKVVMTREDDSFMELGERCDLANNAKADFLICLHRNSYEGGIQGVEAWVNNIEPEADTKLGNNVLRALEKVGVSKNRGVQYGYVGNSGVNYYINSDTVMPSILLELGFITDDTDNELFDSHIDEYSVAIGDAVIETAIDLGVIDKEGNRLIEGQFLSAEKQINSGEEQQANVEYTEPGETPDVYNIQENEAYTEEYSY